MMKFIQKGSHFTAFTEEGNVVQCDILFEFDNDFDHVIVYTDGSEDEDNNTRVFASILGENGELFPASEEDHIFAEKVLLLLQYAFKAGVPQESMSDYIDKRINSSLEEIRMITSQLPQ